MSDYRLTIIEERHMLSALLFIYRSGKAAKTTIYENVSKNPRMPVKLDALKDAGLVNMQYGMPTYVSLTEKGRRIAESISNIEDILSEDHSNLSECDRSV